MAIDLLVSTHGTPLSKNSRPYTPLKIDKITLDSVDKTSTSRDTAAEDLSVTLTMSLDFSITNSVYEKLKVVVVSTQKEGFSSTIKTSGDLNLQKLYNKPGYDIVYHGLLINLVDPKTIHAAIGAAKSRKEKTFKISFELEDWVKEVKEHLSYYTTCFVEPEQENQGRQTYNVSPKSGFKDLGGVRSPTGDLMKLKPYARSGPVSGENVIKSGQLNITSFVYVVTSPGKMKDSYWTGPIIEDKEKNLFSATRKTFRRRKQLTQTDPPMKLERKTVTNSKIQDRRIIKQIPRLNYNLKPADFTPPILQGTARFDNSLKIPNAYTHAFLTRDMEDSCRGVLFFNHLKFITQKSQFGKMLTNQFVPKMTKQKILQNSRIDNIQIIRRRYPGQSTLNYNRLGSPTSRDSAPISEEVTLVAESYSSGENLSIENSKLYSPTLSIGTDNDEMGSITQLSNLKNITEGVTPIAFTDYSIKKIGGAPYQYGVRMKTQDGIVIFLNERLGKLKTIIEYLDQHLSLIHSSKNVMKYYKTFFNKNDPNSTNHIDERKKIYKLQTEFGISMLNNKQIPYPWVVAPIYFEDTVKSVCDGTFWDQPTHASTNFSIVRQSTSAKLASLNNNTRKNKSSRKKNSKPPSTRIFDLNNSFFGMQSLLDPYTATAESVQLAIRLIEVLYQKIESFMGATRQPVEPGLLVKRSGVAKNSKISSLNFEEYFEEYFDTRKSRLPAVDYAGFSTGPSEINFVSPLPTTRNFKKFISPSAKSQAMDFSNLEQHVDAGPLAMDAETWELIMFDEEEMGKPMEYESTPQNNSKETPKQTKKRQSKRQKDHREKLLVKLRKKRDQSGGTKRKSKVNGFQMGPRLISSRTKNGFTIERTSLNENFEKPAQYVDMQNIAVAVLAEVEVTETSQNRAVLPARALGATLGINVAPSRTPMNAAIDLNLNQGKETHMVSEGNILGKKRGLQLKPSAAMALENTDDTSSLLEISKNEKWALPVTQKFMNIVATTGVLNIINKRFYGSSGLMEKTFPSSADVLKQTKYSDPELLPPSVKKYINFLEEREEGSVSPIDMSPSFRFSVGMLAKATIFKGYKNGAMKEPIWESPKNWASLISDLKNSTTSSEVILCRFEKQANEEWGPVSARGLEMAQTNTYFLIAKNKNSLEVEKSQSRRTLRPPIAHADPEAQRSIVVSPYSQLRTNIGN